MLSEALRLLRVYHDLKQKELASQLKLSSSHISELESGSKTPSMEVIQKYAVFFKIPASSILFFSEQILENNASSKTDNKVRNAIASIVIKLLKTIEMKTEISDDR